MNSKYLDSDSILSYSNSHDPEILGKVSKRASSRFGEKKWFGMWKDFSLSSGIAPSISKRKFKLNRPG